MSSTDVRDVLNLPDGLSSGSRPAKKQKVSSARPNLKGLAREVHNLGGDNPIAIVPEVTQFKKRRLASRKLAARWELRPFRNSAREDVTLILRHWRRKDVRDGVNTDRATAGAITTETTTNTTNTTTPTTVAEEQGGESEQQQQQQQQQRTPEDEIEDSAFAKYNVCVSVPKYSDEQYLQNLQSENWTREETDYLVGLVREFDLRWPLIWDRYEWSPPALNGEADADGDESKAVVPAPQTRAMEDLKARYYEVAARMIAVNKPVQYMTQSEYALHELMTHYNPQQEKLRKEFAVNSLSRSRDEAREEESLLLEIKRILARSERFNEERRELYSRLDYPRADTDISSFKSSAGLQTLLQNLMNVDKSKKRKSIMGADGAGAAAAQGTPQTAAQEALAKKEAGAGGTIVVVSQHDSTGPTASTPTAAGKKTAHERRKLTPHEEAIYGVSHHDRLSSGPTFRTEKINKLFSHKSNQQQLRISNTLSELDVPSKLAMPTMATTAQFEALLAAVTSLLDARKLSDKLDAEIKLEQAKRAERERKMHPPAGSSGPAAVAAPQDGVGGKNDEERDGVGAAAAAAAGKKVGSGDGGGDRGGEGVASSIEESGTDAAAAADKDGASRRPVGSGAGMGAGSSHKRSASVLSAMSDKSSKRQKK